MVKHLPTIQETGFNPWVGKIPWRRDGLPTPVCLPGEFHAQRSLAGYIQSMGSQRVGQDRATNTSELLEKESRGSWPQGLLTCGLHLCQELENLNKWGLNIFRVSDYAGGRSLSCIMYTVFQVG